MGAPLRMERLSGCARPVQIGAIANQSQQHEHSGPTQAIHIK
jgi:hypothetical protein